MGLTIQQSVPAFTIFLQGLLSFFSPCVLPLIPLYLGYLAGGGKQVNSQGEIDYPRGKVLLNTLFFVLGISATFFLLGFGFTVLGRFFSANKLWFARISGLIMLLFGLYQLGIFGQAKAIEGEHRLAFDLNRWVMGPIPAFLLGFTFSFAWTPCIGPVLAGVLLMAGNSASYLKSALLIGVYNLGFILPFLALGLFTGSVLAFFKKHRNIVSYTVKIGAVLLILMGIMTATGLLNSFTSALTSSF